MARTMTINAQMARMAMSSAVSRSLRGSRIESCDHDDDADECEIVDAEQYEDLIFNGRDTHVRSFPAAGRCG